MTKLAELRAAIEAIRITDGDMGSRIIGIPNANHVLDALEQALVMDVENIIAEAWHPEGYDTEAVNLAHRKLSEILNDSPTTGDTE